MFQDIGPRISLFKTETMIWNWDENIDGTYLKMKIEDIELGNTPHTLEYGLVITHLYKR